MLSRDEAESKASLLSLCSHCSPSVPVGAIVGGVIGGLVVIGLLAALVVWLCVPRYLFFASDSLSLCSLSSSRSYCSSLFSLSICALLMCGAV